MKMRIIDYINRHEGSLENTINLVASENILSMDARISYVSDIISRYSFDDSDLDFFFPGRAILADIEKKCCGMIAELLSVKHVNVKPISGLNCMLSLIGSLTKKDDILFSIAPENGGHGATKPLAERLGIRHRFLPFNNDKMDFDIASIDTKIRREKKIKMVYLDFMNILFPVDVKRLCCIMPKNTFVIFDGSHLMGLIMGKAFPNPIEDGADFLIGSTHKTLPGPHKGIIATNKALYSKLFNHFWPLFISHHHIADVAALGIMIELLKDSIQQYAEQVVLNAKLLALKLFEGGMKVQCRNKGFTNTHQIWIDVGSKDEVFECVKRFANYGIILNAVKIPTLNNNWGIRIGVQEVTFKGFNEDEIELLSEIILRVYNNKSVSSTYLKRELEYMNSKIKSQYFDNCMDNLAEFINLKRLNARKHKGSLLDVK